MSPELEKRIASLAEDRQSGASELLAAAIGILRDALHAADEVGEVGRALCRAQPSMAPMWNAAMAADAAADDPPRFERFAQRVARAPQAIARFAAETLLVGTAPGAVLRLVTISYSGTVRHALEALGRARPLHVACAEGRPALEGRRLAARLAGSGAMVECFSDAAIAHPLERADAVLVGADAVTPEWFVNKSGTLMLAAAAAGRGIPVYVLAGREKFLPPGLAARLEGREGPSVEVWADPPRGVTVRNPYFEKTPLELVSAVISDVGALSMSDIVKVCLI
ncbi:MAG: translation initiation factor eIF-2B [Vicinamibacterales bacterium]